MTSAYRPLAEQVAYARSIEELARTQDKKLSALIASVNVRTARKNVRAQGRNAVMKPLTPGG